MEQIWEVGYTTKRMLRVLLYISTFQHGMEIEPIENPFHYFKWNVRALGGALVARQLGIET
jgi:hypothetical protein